MSSGDKKSGDSASTPQPIVADETERSISSVAIVDVISEGPILGLVNGGQSIYLDQEQWQQPSGVFNRMGIRAHFRHGVEEQEPLPYQWTEQTFDVNATIKSTYNHVELYNPGGAFYSLGLSVDPSRGLLISNASSAFGSLPPTANLITVGSPGTGAKQTAVPTQQPIGDVVYDATHNAYTPVLLNPGANVLGDSHEMFYATFYWNTGGASPGWLIALSAQIHGGVVRTITNPNARACRVILKVDKLFQQSGNGDVQPAVMRFAIQYKRTSDDAWHHCDLLNQNYYPFPIRHGYQLPMAQPFVVANWNWFSILGLFGPQFEVNKLRCEVAVSVAPRSRFTVHMQYKDSIFGPFNPDVDPRAPDEGWVDITLGEADTVYKPSYSGYNPSDSSQVMRVMLYWHGTINAFQRALRIKDDFGNNIIEATWAWATHEPTFNSFGSVFITGQGDGVQALYVKTQSGIQLDYTVVLPVRRVINNASEPEAIQLRVIKLTEDDIYTDIDAPSAMTSQGIAITDVTYRTSHWIRYSSLSWAAYVELVESTIQYSDTSVCGLEFNSQWSGQSIPQRAYDVYGRIIRVPSNYNGSTHTYTGLWDGTFQLAWTDNPVWIFLDLLTHERYGLGQWITDDMIDFSSLYQVAQYCDEPVTTDGDLTACPRFTFNTQIVSQDQAYNVLAMLSSVFRGMIYWAAGGITVTQDCPKDPTRVVTPANVIGGEFQYAGSSLQARHSVVLVQWNDQNNFGRDRTDVWEDPELIERYGYVTTEMKAWGCTRFSQAMRMARWLLDTEKFATEVVTYRAGFDHADARPGEIVAIADPTISGIRHGGRIIQSSFGTQIILDAPFAFHASETYTLTILIPTWGKVSINTGGTTVTGTETNFTMGGGYDTIVFAGQSKRYRCFPTTGTSIFLPDEPYIGPNLVNADYALFDTNSFPPHPELFVRSSVTPIVETPIVNPGSVTTDIVNVLFTIPTPSENASFIITASSVAPRLFTIVSNKEIDTHTYEISALQYDPTKFDRIEED